MPKKAIRKDKQAALRQRHTAPFSAPESPPNGGGENDPPIIISGGSVTIRSLVELDFSREGKWFVYSTDEIKVKKIKTKGRKDQQDESDDGKFEIRLLDKDEK